MPWRGYYRTNVPIDSRLVKHLVRLAKGSSRDLGLAYENDRLAHCFTTKESKERIAAFNEKRAPQFWGERRTSS